MKAATSLITKDHKNFALKISELKEIKPTSKTNEFSENRDETFTTDVPLVYLRTYVLIFNVR